MVTNPPEKTIVQRLRSTCCASSNSLCWPLAHAPANSRRDRRIMGHRLSKIVTRTGDAGTTGLGDGSRVAKDSARIDAIGAVDELNSTVGLLLAEALPDAVAAGIKRGSRSITEPAPTLREGVSSATTPSPSGRSTP